MTADNPYEKRQIWLAVNRELEDICAVLTERALLTIKSRERMTPAMQEMAKIRAEECNSIVNLVRARKKEEG